MCSTMIDVKRTKSRDTTGTNDADCELESTIISNSIAKVLKVVIKRLLRTIKALILIKI